MAEETLLFKTCESGGIGRPACRQAGAHKLMFFVYAIKSLTKNYIYVGLTANTEIRIAEHNRKKEKTTRSYAPFETILTEEYDTRIEARKREKYLKSGAGKEYLKSL
jgi:putative endonuclease